MTSFLDMFNDMGLIPNINDEKEKEEEENSSSLNVVRKCSRDLIENPEITTLSVLERIYSHISNKNPCKENKSMIFDFMLIFINDLLREENNNYEFEENEEIIIGKIILHFRNDDVPQNNSFQYELIEKIYSCLEDGSFVHNYLVMNYFYGDDDDDDRHFLTDLLGFFIPSKLHLIEKSKSNNYWKMLFETENAYTFLRLNEIAGERKFHFQKEFLFQTMKLNQVPLLIINNIFNEDNGDNDFLHKELQLEILKRQSEIKKFILDDDFFRYVHYLCCEKIHSHQVLKTYNHDDEFQRLFLRYFLREENQTDLIKNQGCEVLISSISYQVMKETLSRGEGYHNDWLSISQEKYNLFDGLTKFSFIKKQIIEKIVLDLGENVIDHWGGRKHIMNDDDDNQYTNDELVVMYWKNVVSIDESIDTFGIDIDEVFPKYPFKKRVQLLDFYVGEDSIPVKRLKRKESQDY